ncbi:dipeptidyl aminopeptidase [Cylindrobasidium torrendii FP15055 ss-10]|uniref:Dipeptidyl aminopeptidase n=1 Tax=Cylindrobasidium torrendii FP15055 ss-10 TaxID=1314674 RepID=A0A0D7BBC4_9AGAR|nr:dipeptidyl aminopeptidase [Cylindrobasidium torrendii FP15055 ss-10]
MAPDTRYSSAETLDDDDATITSSRPPRRTVYYNDGPFDAPSSEDEDEVPFLDKSQSMGEAERGFGQTSHREQRPAKPSSVRFLVITLCALVALATVIGVFAARSYVGTVYRLPGYHKITMDDIFNGTFRSEYHSIEWVAEAGDGVFSIETGDAIQLVDLKTNETRTLVNTTDMTNDSGSKLEYHSWSLSADMKYLLLKADYKKQWRHSSFGNYYIHDIAAKSTKPLVPPTNPPTTAYANWSPSGQSIAFVSGNDLYVLASPTSGTPTRVTSSGSTTLFHGVPDWVYEEEVFSDEFALWWSPDSNKVAFLKLDEAKVEEYTFPIYNPTDNSSTITPYPSETTMKYPKPGYANPLVDIFVYDIDKKDTIELDWPNRFPREDAVIQEVTWVGDDELIIKEVTRNATAGSVVYFDAKDLTKGQIVRKLGKEGEEGDNGWIEPNQNIHPVEGGYLDVVPTKDGWSHIALFSPVNSSEPIWLTSGAWEVTSGIKAFDKKNNTVYFEAASPTPVERNLYSVSLPKDNGAPSTVSLTASPQEDIPSYYSSSFSPEAGYYVLTYLGPDVPWQRIIKADSPSFDYVLSSNIDLRNTTSVYEAPTIIHSTLNNDGYDLNVVEMRPPRMDGSGRTKYPVLFKVYGGPNSQTVNQRFSREWEHYLACSLEYVIVSIDGRGTAAGGRGLRSVVKDNLGWYEVIDQVAAAREWASRDYVDPQRIGVWGWSYGGYMAAKVVEKAAGVHTLAMSVAPVTDWRLYDSVYTERYMGLPKDNVAGYDNSSVSDMEGFKSVDYLLAHGSGDDNVHYSNSARLLDMLTTAKVRTGFWFRMFTDSDHGISTRGAHQEIYEYLTAFLMEKWGRGGRRRGW